jgi:cytoskeletal protein CcmA (bactofilin family)
MFKKWSKLEGVNMNDEKRLVEERQKVNTILKGSKLIGDITISCDLELSGEVEGNITSEQNSNIVIKGVCKGNIKTGEGNVTIEGELSNGDIITDSDVKITGKFNGGKIKAKGKIYIDGEFKGELESGEIELGPNAQGKGELFYKEYISISKGAKVDVRISQVQEELRVIKKSADTKVVNIEFPAKERSE